jgi:choline dehydrogenase
MNENVDTGSETTDEVDYVIVGAGAAGCVLANRLTSDGKHTVRLLEAGGGDRHIWIKVPAGFSRTIYNRKLNWNYETAPSEGIRDRTILFPRGRVIGGSSSINGHLYVRGQAADYDHWAQLGCRGWSWDDVLPFFKRAETHVGGDDAVRGREGPLSIENHREVYPLTHAFCETLVNLGLPANADYNSGDQEGTFTYQQMMRNGRRWSAADAYLHPIKTRSNLQIESGALATKVLLDGRRVTGVAYKRGGASHTVRARREVILCGGSINSPQLMQLSGIGDPQHLADIGVPVAHALPGVGRNLKDHIAARMAVRVKNAKTMNADSRGLRLVGQVLRYAVWRRGLLATSPGHGGAFYKTRPELATPDMQLFFAPASYDAGRVGAAALEVEPGMTCGASQLRPESRGHVLAVSADPTVAPEIQPNYLDDPIDQAAIMSALTFIRKIFRTSPLADFTEVETFPGPDMPDDQLLEHVRQTGSTIYHPIGSCRMGSDPEAVVDLSLRVNGLSGLRVVDASIMPNMVSGNTYAATNMIAEKGATHILADA